MAFFKKEIQLETNELFRGFAAFSHECIQRFIIKYRVTEVQRAALENANQNDIFSVEKYS
jgi:hypothetical protein